MKKYFSLLVFLLIIFLIALGIYLNTSKVNPPEKIVMPEDKTATPTAPNQEGALDNTNLKTFSPPLDKSKERANKKTFGIFITPKNSPIQPERFSGYHTGTDFEIFPEELNLDINVKSVCNGKLLLKKYASGYGGIAVEICEIDGQPATIIYGHLKLSTISLVQDDSISAGDTIGILGSDKSIETNGERKHLHLGIHKGTVVNIKGYVQKQSELSNWLDPCLYVCND